MITEIYHGFIAAAVYQSVKPFYKRVKKSINKFITGISNKIISKQENLLKADTANVAEVIAKYDMIQDQNKKLIKALMSGGGGIQFTGQINEDENENKE